MKVYKLMLNYSLPVVSSEGYHACKDNGQLGHRIPWYRTCIAPSSWAARYHGWSCSGPPGGWRGNTEMSVWELMTDKCTVVFYHVGLLSENSTVFLCRKCCFIEKNSFLLLPRCIAPQCSTCRWPFLSYPGASHSDSSFLTLVQHRLQLHPTRHNHTYTEGERRGFRWEQEMLHVITFLRSKTYKGLCLRGTETIVFVSIYLEAIYPNDRDTLDVTREFLPHCPCLHYCRHHFPCRLVLSHGFWAFLLWSYPALPCLCLSHDNLYHLMHRLKTYLGWVIFLGWYRWPTTSTSGVKIRQGVEVVLNVPVNYPHSLSWLKESVNEPCRFLQGRWTLTSASVFGLLVVIEFFWIVIVVIIPHIVIVIFTIL